MSRTRTPKSSEPRPIILYAAPNSALVASARAFLASAPAVVPPGADLSELPPGTVFICSPEHARQLVTARPADVVLIARGGALDDPPWRQLAHDVRGPLAVIRGVLEDLEGGPMVSLGLRGALQIAHMADCWEALGTPQVDLREESLDDLLDRTITAFTAIEPRRASQILIERSALSATTDASRIVLGLARFLGHAVRATRSPIRMRGAEAAIAIDSEGSLEVLTTPPSSALATALSVLTPVASLEVDGPGKVRWVLRATQ